VATPVVPQDGGVAIVRLSGELLNPLNIKDAIETR
jgi:hypothetical protein